MRRVLGAAAVFAALVVAKTVVGAGPTDGVVVHEWGTFLAMNGSDGVTLDGMYHEEHALPEFVHARGREELRVPRSNIKGETPVIYFYTDRAQSVSVEVGFPQGTWTQWFPQASFAGPPLAAAGSPDLTNGRIGWTVSLLPPGPSVPSPPKTSADALWNYARDVDAAFVQSGQTVYGPAETERFIFYRGLGRSTLPLSARADGDGQLACGSGITSLHHVYVLRVENGRGAYRYLPELACGTAVQRVVPAMNAALPIQGFASEVSGHLAGSLVASGLYPKEARAMVNTWRSSYFETDGIRVLFVLPQQWTDRFIPMRVTPKPSEIVRVMVGRVELLSAERERAIERAITSLSSPDSRQRQDGFDTLVRQGRYAQPVVRRTLETSHDEQVRMLARRLLYTSFMTDIRSSIENAPSHEWTPEYQAYGRAQLASLLREVGLTEQASQEAGLALTALAALPRPTMKDHQSRNTYRAWARAEEGAGHDAEALRWYGEFIEFGAGFTRCSTCHANGGPRDLSFFPGWWAGRKFGEVARRTGRLPDLVAQEQATLRSSPDNLSARLRLAYLYDAAGDTSRSRTAWAQIVPPQALRAAITP